jgi:hypothetical protein
MNKCSYENTISRKGRIHSEILSNMWFCPKHFLYRPQKIGDAMFFKKGRELLAAGHLLVFETAHASYNSAQQGKQGCPKPQWIER